MTPRSKSTRCNMVSNRDRRCGHSLWKASASGSDADESKIECRGRRLQQKGFGSDGARSARCHNRHTKWRRRHTFWPTASTKFLRSYSVTSWLMAYTPWLNSRATTYLRYNYIHLSVAAVLELSSMALRPTAASKIKRYVFIWAVYPYRGIG